MLHFSTTAEESTQYGTKMLVYGESGVGKTSLALTAPAPFIVNSDKGQLALRKAAIPMATIYDDQDLKDVQQWIANSAEARQFGTFFVDSATSIADAMLDTELRKGRKDPRLAYGEAGRNIINFVRWARDFRGPHFVILAEVDYLKDQGGAVRTQPRLPGQKVGPEMAYKFDVVAYMGVHRDGQTNTLGRYLQCQPDQQRTAKDRSGALAEVEPADLGYIFNKIAQS